MPETNDFRVVTRRGRRTRSSRGVHALVEDRENERKLVESDIDAGQVVRRVLEAVEEIKDTGYRRTLLEGLDEALRLIGASSLSEIVCYGLGNFSQTKAARYQLAAILTIASHFPSQVVLYDPLFFETEIKILKKLGLSTLESNEEAKRAVSDKTSLIYMPHCPYQLTNNFIYANWSVDSLANCVILSNSFGDLVDSVYLRNIEESTNYISRVHPYATEIELSNHFSHEEVFNGSAVHIFSRETLERVPIDFWEDRREPIYQENCEFIRKSPKQENIV